MKTRIGFGLGVNQLLDRVRDLGEVVDALESLGFDSLWMSERVVGPAPDPIAALSFAAGRTRRLKLGTNVLVLPGRNPVVLAKQLATLDELSEGRFLPVVGLGTRDADEHHAFGVDATTRGSLFEECLATLRAVWSATSTPVTGPAGDVRELAVYPKPARRLSVWLGGRSSRELDRVGRLGDGWLASFQSPAETEVARGVIEKAAADAGRVIDADHFGTVVLYERTVRSERATRLVERNCPGAPLSIMLPAGREELVAAIEEYVAGGLSKFVLIPASPPSDWSEDLSWLRATTEHLEM